MRGSKRNKADEPDAVSNESQISVLRQRFDVGKPRLVERIKMVETSLESASDLVGTPRKPSKWPWYEPMNMTIFLRLLYSRHSRIASVVASVPVFTHVTRSLPVTWQNFREHSPTISCSKPSAQPPVSITLQTASRTKGALCPNIIGPKPPLTSIISWPSTSVTWLPAAFWTRIGWIVSLSACEKFEMLRLSAREARYSCRMGESVSW